MIFSKYRKIYPICIVTLLFLLWPPFSFAKKPIIGILMNQGNDTSYSIYPWYAIRKNYSDVITKLGGIPVFIGHNEANIKDYIQIIDGFVLQGAIMPLPKKLIQQGLLSSIPFITLLELFLNLT